MKKQIIFLLLALSVSTAQSNRDIVNANLVAGTQVVGKVGIDQTTPGTTNAVQATNLPSTVATGNGATNANTVRVALATDSAGPVFVTNLPSTVATNSSTADASTIRVVPATNQAFPTSTGSPSTSNAAGGIQDTAGVGRALASRIFPSSNASDAIGPLVNGSAGSSLVLKASAGNLYDAYANSTVAGLLMVFDATTAPVDGAVTPKHCIPVAANGIGSLTFNSGPPESYTTGITLVFSSGTNCFSKTASATAFLHGRVQ